MGLEIDVIYPGPGPSNEQQLHVCESKRKPNRALRGAPCPLSHGLPALFDEHVLHRTLSVFSSSRSPVSHNVGMIQFVACLLTGRK